MLRPMLAHILFDKLHEHQERFLGHEYGRMKMEGFAIFCE